jgi:hypothetical protein
MRALNYAYMGNVDEAVVEARKVSAFLAELNDRLGAQRLAYSDDPFAQYLSALLFEDQGRGDDARISYKLARDAYARSADQLGVPPPRFDLGEEAPGSGELVFLHYAGPAPRRETVTWQIAWGHAVALVAQSKEAEGDVRVQNALAAGIMGHAITVALPIFVQDPFAVQGSEIDVAGLQRPTVVVEDVTRIAHSTLESLLPTIRIKAVTRATVKYLLARLAENEARKKGGDTWGALVGLVGQVAAAATETADTRCWAAIPAQIRMARVRLPPGVHAVKVRYLGAGGSPAGEETLPRVEVAAGKRTYIHVRTLN